MLRRYSGVWSGERGGGKPLDNLTRTCSTVQVYVGGFINAKRNLVSVCLSVGVGCPCAPGAGLQASSECVHGSANNVCQASRPLSGEAHEQ